MAKLVFITGASSGIGQALALAYYEAGYSLALVARRTEEIKSWSSRHNISLDRYKIYSANVGDIDSIVAAGKACIAAQGLPDVVIANAGISVGVDTAIREDLDQMAQTFATNNIGLAATFHPFIEGMLQRKSGKLVGIGSVAGIRGMPGHGAYCGSKAAVINMVYINILLYFLFLSFLLGVLLLSLVWNSSRSLTSNCKFKIGEDMRH